MTSGGRYDFRHCWRSSLFATLLIFLSAGSVHADTVCVLYFENNTGDTEYDVLGKGLADMFVTELSSVDDLELVERSRLDDLLGELELQRGEAFDPETVQELGKVAGARYAVTGSFSRFQDTFRIDARMIEVENGKVVTASKVEGEKSDFFRLVSDLSGSFSEALGAHFDPDKSALGEGVDVETALAYSKAIDLADQGQLSEASAQLTKIVSGSSNFILAKDRYRDIMKRIYEARSRRKEGLSSAQLALLGRIDTLLGGDAPYLGFKVRGVRPGHAAVLEEHLAVPEGTGAWVGDIAPGSPGEQAGFSEPPSGYSCCQDLLISFNGVRLSGAAGDRLAREGGLEEEPELDPQCRSLLGSIITDPSLSRESSADDEARYEQYSRCQRMKLVIDSKKGERRAKAGVSRHLEDLLKTTAPGDKVRLEIARTSETYFLEGVADLEIEQVELTVTRQNERARSRLDAVQKDIRNRTQLRDRCSGIVDADAVKRMHECRHQVELQEATQRARNVEVAGKGVPEGWLGIIGRPSQISGFSSMKKMKTYGERYAQPHSMIDWRDSCGYEVVEVTEGSPAARAKSASEDVGQPAELTEELRAYCGNNRHCLEASARSAGKGTVSPELQMELYADSKCSWRSEKPCPVQDDGHGIRPSDVIWGFNERGPHESFCLADNGLDRNDPFGKNTSLALLCSKESIGKDIRVLLSRSSDTSYNRCTATLSLRIGGWEDFPEAGKDCTIKPAIAVPEEDPSSPYLLLGSRGYFDAADGKNHYTTADVVSMIADESCPDPALSSFDGDLNYLHREENELSQEIEEISVLSAKTPEAIERHLSYRLLRGEVLLKALQNLGKAKSSGAAEREDLNSRSVDSESLKELPIPAASVPEARKLALMYVENADALLSEMHEVEAHSCSWADHAAEDGRGRETVRECEGGARWSIPRMIHPQDLVSARDISGDLKAKSFGELVDGGTSSVARSLAAFVCLGSVSGMSEREYTTSFVSQGHRTQWQIRPTPLEMEPSLLPRVAALIDTSLDDLSGYASQATVGKAEVRMGEIGALGLFGDCLLIQGETMQAIAKWQTILDEYPTAPDFDFYEDKIRRALTDE